MAMLKVTDLKVYYGVIQAIKGISFEVNEGEVIALIGANGAGKTTILHTVTGLVEAKAGTVEFEGRDITKMPGHKLSLIHILAFKMHMGIGKCRNNGQAVHVDLFAAGIGIRNTVSGEYNFIPVNNHDGKTAVFIVTGYKMPVGQNFHKKLPFLK